MNNKKDVILIGAGIMSATLAVLLKKLDPQIKIKIYEVLDTVADESSAAMNNAGTGHSGFCELNYTPEKPDGSVDISKAITIASEFAQSKEFWAYLVQEGYLQDPSTFIKATPHYSFVNNDKNVEFLKKRFEALKTHPLFSKMEYSEDSKVIKQWLPLVMEGRSDESVGATRMSSGTDVNFENITKQIIDSLLQRNEIELHCGHFVKDLVKDSKNNKWNVEIINIKTQNRIKEKADFVFIGAGGGAIFLLEKSKIPEASGFGGFPVGGEWLVCENEDMAKRHNAKVYGQAQVGAPPMSVPHLDTRIIDGKSKLLFGPFAIFSTKFLKHGSYFDLFKSLKVDNLGFMAQAGLKNMDLTKYLIQQVSQSKEDKIKELQVYLPSAKIEDWTEESAGQRVQVIKKDKQRGGILQFGTEIVSNKDGSISALLGASPGASTSVSVMIEVIRKCFSDSPEWNQKLDSMIPSLKYFNKDESKIAELMTKAHKTLKLE